MEQGGTKLSFQEKLARQISCERSAAADAGKAKRPPYKVNVRRFFAFLLDGLVIKCVGILIGWTFAKRLMPLGGRGWWVGLIVIVLYFSIFDSGLCKGKTIGKRLLHIETIRTGGKYLSPLDAFFKFSPFALIAFIGCFVKNENEFAWPIAGLNIFSLFVGLAMVSFILFHPHRRSIGDLIADSVVARCDENFSLQGASVKKPLLALLIASIIFVGPYVGLSAFIISHPSGKEMTRIWEMLSKRTDIQDPKVTILPAFDREKKEFVSTLDIRAHVEFMDTAPASKVSNKLMEDIWKSIIGRNMSPPTAKAIRITLWYGYNIGIGGLAITKSKTFPNQRNVIPIRPRGGRIPAKEPHI
jgi:uncharacterized RDD family membrane protein YckC